MVAEALRADKVDAALYDSTTESLVAVGTSHTPMGRKQHAIGMNRLPVANGGREVDAFLTGVPYATGQADQDPGQLRGMTEGLGIRSAVMVPLEWLEHAAVSSSLLGPTRFLRRRRRALPGGRLALGRDSGLPGGADGANRYRSSGAGRRVAADELIATLAHDLGNLLVPVKGRIDLLQRRARREDRPRDLRDVEEAAGGRSRGRPRRRSPG